MEFDTVTTDGQAESGFNTCRKKTKVVSQTFLMYSVSQKCH